MAPHRAQLNMNKPSSADTPAKPNSACRHHCRTEQEALDPSLACTNELQWLRRHAIKALFQSQLPIKRNIMALNNPAVVFFFLSPFCLPILAHCCDKRCNRDCSELRERGGRLARRVFEEFQGWNWIPGVELPALWGLSTRDGDWIWCVLGSCCRCRCFKGSWANVKEAGILQVRRNLKSVSDWTIIKTGVY